MSNGFDAYHKWLSIPPHEQPPNHYRLLGLELFESDPDVISAAADRQMAHVQTYKTGPNSALSQQLLNEIASAKLCLLRPQKRAAYDQQLQRQPKAPELPAIAAPARAAPAHSGTLITPPPPTIPPPATVVPPPVHSQPVATATLLVIASAVMAVLLIVGIVVLMANRVPNAVAPSTLVSPPTPASNTVSQNVTTKTDSAPTTSRNNAASQAIEKRSEPIAPKPIAAAISKTVENTKIPAFVKLPSKPTVQPPAQIDNKVAATTSANNGVKPAPTAVGTPPIGAAPATPAAGAPQAAKAAVPDKATLDTVSRQTPNPPDAKPAEILDQARKATTAPQAYVLLRRALDRAVEQGDAATAISAADELTRRFALDGVQLRWRTLDDLQTHVGTSDSWSALAGAAAAMLDDPAIAVQADLAQRLAELGITAARRSGNLDTIRKVTLRILRMRSAAPAASGPSSSS